MVPNSNVCRDRGTFADGDDVGSVFFLDDRMHGPTCLGRIIRIASNMPMFFVHCG